MISTIVHGIFALMFLIFAIVIFLGKGDNMIAGYNTMSKEEKKKCNIKRLRTVMGFCCLLLACVMAIYDIIGFGLMIAATMLICVVTVVLANTWAMK